MAWNGFPSHVRKSICNKFLKETKKTDRTLVEKPTLWLNLPYLGKSGQFLVNNLEKKLNKSLSDFKLKVMYKTNKLAMFCSNKDKLNPLNKANVVYLFTCPGCSKTNIGKTERNLITRLEEHVEGRESAINLHLNVCSSYHDTLSLFKIFYDKFNFKMHKHTTIISSTKIIDIETNWLKLLFLEAYYIKTLKPELNTGVRAGRDLQLF